ncbi:MAG TPA: hypothetical protein VG674_01390 [Amycolatopsis sp.]|jgi:hypothetical protein|nr:hypothetical protein [Amycolatopsis sp.]
MRRGKPNSRKSRSVWATVYLRLRCPVFQLSLQLVEPFLGVGLGFLNPLPRLPLPGGGVPDRDLGNVALSRLVPVDTCRHAVGARAGSSTSAWVHDDARLELLKASARRRMVAGRGRLGLGLDTPPEVKKAD